MSNLNPGQFAPIFHGTSGYVKDDGKVLPPSVHGQESYWAGSRPHGDDPAHLAFATPNEHVAWEFAHQRPREDTRPRVYEVEHVHDERIGRDLGDDEVVSPTGFPIKRRIDIMPGRQGTFPQINWIDHAHPVGRDIWDPEKRKAWDAVDSSNVNHPNDDQIAYGHRDPNPVSREKRKSQETNTTPDPNQGRLF